MSDGNAYKIPIPGAAGAAVHVGLQSLALYCGEAKIVIEKKRVPGGGYTYWVSNLNKTLQQNVTGD